MNHDELAGELRNLSDKATAGPWRTASDAQGPCGIMHPTENVAVASLTDTHIPLNGFVEIEAPGAPERTANALLIVTLRNHVPDLLSALDRLEIAEALLAKLHGQFGLLPDITEVCRDWACVKCKPYSDMLVEGFLCGYHATAEYFAEQSEPRKERAK